MLRRFTWGWLSAVLAFLCSIALVSLVMGIMFAVVTQQCKTLVGMDQNTYLTQQVAGLMSIVLVLFLLACSLTSVPFISLAIFGGVGNMMPAFNAGAGVAAGYAKAGAGRVGRAMGL
jgi:type IV secretory pathway VirB6-like protein